MTTPSNNEYQQSHALIRIIGSATVGRTVIVGVFMRSNLDMRVKQAVLLIAMSNIDDVFTIQDAKDFFDTDATARQAVWMLIKQGYVELSGRDSRDTKIKLYRVTVNGFRKAVEVERDLELAQRYVKQ